MSNISGDTNYKRETSVGPFNWDTNQDFRVEIPTSTQRRRQLQGRQRIHKLPPQLREGAAEKHIFDPVVLSLGPYHHGKPQFSPTEGFKQEVLNMFIADSISIDKDKNKNFYYGKILERIDEIRSCYVGPSPFLNGDGRELLTEMMLRDTCFIIYYICMKNDDRHWNHMSGRVGMSVMAFMFRDFLMVENQIPLWVVRLLMHLRYSNNYGDELIYKFLSYVNFRDHRLTRLPWDDNKFEEPVHLLDAIRVTLVRYSDSTSPNDDNDDDDGDVSVELVENGDIVHAQPPGIVIIPRIFRYFRWQQRLWKWWKLGWGSDNEIISLFKMEDHPFYTVTDLNAKGIHFRPSSYCVNDIRFDSGMFSGRLQLPIWFVTTNSKVFFSNIVAFEMFPQTDADMEMISYVNFMKSLIDSPDDVKELRKKGILFSDLDNDEEIVRMFKEIETYGCDNEYLFQNVKVRMEAHCNSMAKTWIAELIHTHFHSPWTVIALLAAIFLGCLTIIQTFYTIHPVKNN